MGFFGILGLFALWGIGSWISILIVLIVADAIWTHGLATTYMHGTGVILSQFWSFIQTFISIMQRLIAMAPRAFQIGIFMIVGVFILGLLVNWFVTIQVVCNTNGKESYVPMFGDSLMNVWMAKSLPIDEMNLSNNVISSERSKSTDLLGCECSGYEKFITWIGYSGVNGSLERCNNDTLQELCRNDTIVVSSNEYDVDSSTKNKTRGIVDLFSIDMSRSKFISNSISEDNKSFVYVDNAGKVVTYSCDKDQVQVGLFGFENVLSMNVLLFIMGLGCMGWLLKFMNVI